MNLYSYLSVAAAVRRGRSLSKATVRVILNMSSPTGNGLLDALPQNEREAILPNLKRVSFEAGQILYRSGERISNVYFPTSAVFSMVTVMHDVAGVEIDMIGCEGLVGTYLVWGAEETPHQTLCQGAGDAWGIRALSLRACIKKGGHLRLLMEHHSHVQYVCMSQFIACNRFHTLTQRCARWLLAAHDRVDRNEFSFTQDFLALMLGANRQSVSVVVARLRKAGLIRYSRGRLTIANRKGLKSAACECYQIIAGQYKRLLTSYAKTATAPD
jgi:CRP-like cAMP-binding protein